MNEVIKGDCLEVLKKLDPKSVDLVYLDPPFFTQRKHSQKTRDNISEYSFTDVWGDLSEYVTYLEERLIECRRVLKDTGSIFLHCDKTASHYLRISLDKIFGIKNFRSEIIWTYKRWSNSKDGLLNAHQNIFFYSKSEKFKFNRIYTDYSLTTNLDQILQARERNHHNKSVYKRDEEGEIILGKEKLGVPLSDVWEIPFLNPKADERVGYPTQKPIILLERIIALVTEVGDVVLDPFCGSGTTLVAASLLNRKYLGIDISKDAIELSRGRIKKPVRTDSPLLKKGKEAYSNKDEFVRIILSQIDANIVQRNKGIDGFLKKHYAGKPVAVYVQRKDQSLSEAIFLLRQAGNKKNVSKKILIRTSNPATLLGKINDELLGKDVVIVDHLEYQIKALLKLK